MSRALPLLLLLLAGCSSPPRWERVEVAPLEGAVDGIDAVVVAPGRVFGLYVLSKPTLAPQRVDGRLAISEDGGRTWLLRSELPARGHVGALAVAVGSDGRRVLLAGGLEGDLLRSDDDGESWAPLASPEGTEAFAVAMPPGEPDRMTVLCEAGRVVVSADRGATWTAAGQPGGLPAALLMTGERTLVQTSEGIFERAPDGAWTSLGGHPGYPGSGRLEACAAGAGLLALTKQGGTTWVLRSDDGGKSWTKLEGTDGAHDVAADPDRPATVYILDATHAPCVSDDGGLTWRPLGLRLQAATLVVLPGEPRTLLGVGTGSRIVERHVLGP